MLAKLVSGEEKTLSDLADTRIREPATDEKVKNLTERVDLLEQVLSRFSNSSAASETPPAESAALKASTDS